MALTVAQVVNAARDHHAALTEQYAPSAVGARFLDRWQRSLLVEIARLVPEFVNDTKAHAIVAADFTTGMNLLDPALWPTGVLEVKRLVAQSIMDPTYYGQAEVDLVPFSTELTALPVLGAVLTTPTTLRLMGTAQDWTAYGTLNITVSPTPASLTGQSSLLALPDDALDAASLALAAFYVQRLTTDPAVKAKSADAQVLFAQASDARLGFLQRVQQQQSRQDIRIIEVW